jgi:hypothetical protein
MNAKRRKEIEKILASLEDIEERITALYEEESEAYENLPEAIQDSERGENMLAASEALENAMDEASSIDAIMDSLREALEY